MGLFSKSIKTLDDLFVHTLQDIYYAENQIAKSLPKMIEKATEPQLKQGLQQHLTETQNQIKRLEQVFQMHGQSVKGTTCAAMDGILEEANDILGVANDNDVIDAAIISSAQAVNLAFRFGKMLLEARAQLRVLGLLDHVGQRLRDLVLGVIKILKTVHEEVVQRFDVLGKEAHESFLRWRPLTGFNG